MFESAWQDGSLFGWEEVLACGIVAETKIETEFDEPEFFCHACWKKFGPDRKAFFQHKTKKLHLENTYLMGLHDQE